MSTFYTLLTKIGAAAWVNAQGSGTTVPLTHMALGDGNGATIVPSEAMTALKREVHRVPISSITQDVDNPSWLVIEAVVPTAIGGWTLREVGLIGGAQSSLLAVGNFPETYKPQLAEGSGRDLVIRMVVQVSNTSVVQLTIDPSVALATNQSIANAVAAHEAKADPHPQYLNQARGDARYLRTLPAATTAVAGIVRLALLSEAADLSRHDLAVTPAGLAQVLTQAVAAHKAEADPHIAYFNAERLAALLASREAAGRARRHYFANF